MLRKRLLCIVISCVIFICPLRGEGSTEKVRTLQAYPILVYGSEVTEEVCSIFVLTHTAKGDVVYFYLLTPRLVAGEFAKFICKQKLSADEHARITAQCAIMHTVIDGVHAKKESSFLRQELNEGRYLRHAKFSFVHLVKIAQANARTPFGMQIPVTFHFHNLDGDESFHILNGMVIGGRIYSFQ